MLRLVGKVEGGLRISEDELLVGQEEHLKELKKLLGLAQGRGSWSERSPRVPRSGHSGREGHGWGRQDYHGKEALRRGGCAGVVHRGRLLAGGGPEAQQ